MTTQQVQEDDSLHKDGDLIVPTDSDAGTDYRSEYPGGWEGEREVSAVEGDAHSGTVSGGGIGITAEPDVGNCRNDSGLCSQDDHEVRRKRLRQGTLEQCVMGLQHNADVNQIYSHLREIRTNAERLHTEITVVKGRVSTVETKVSEHNGMLIDLKRAIGHLERDLASVVKEQAHIVSLANANNELLLRHTLEEAERMERSIKGQQRLTKYVLLVFGVLGMLTLTLAALHQHFAGVPLHESIFKFIGLLG